MHQEAYSLMFTFPRDLIVFDFETTGTVPGYHDPIQLAAIRLDRHTLEEKAAFESKIKPIRPENADIEALKVTGRTFEDLEDLAKTAPEPAAVIKDFEEAMFGKHTPPDEKAWYFMRIVLAGQNVRFDMNFLNEMLAENGYPRDRYGYHAVDTMTLCFIAQGAMGFQTDERNRLNLDAQAKAFGIPRGEEHDALEDVRVTAEVLRRYARGIQRGHNAYLWAKDHEEDIKAAMKAREEREEVSSDLQERIVSHLQPKGSTNEPLIEETPRVGLAR